MGGMDLIIIEGPDGSGKSKLAKRLSADLKIPVIHQGPAPATKEECNERKYRACYYLTQDVIQDRSTLISEPIYGVLIRKDAWITVQESTSILKAFKNIVVIYCGIVIGHEESDHDTAEYLKDLWRHEKEVVDLYAGVMEHLKLSSIVVHKYTYDYEACMRFLSCVRPTTGK